MDDMEQTRPINMKPGPGAGMVGITDPVLGATVTMHMGASTVHVYFTLSHEEIALHPDHWNSLESILDGLKDSIPSAVAEYNKIRRKG